MRLGLFALLIATSALLARAGDLPDAASPLPAETQLPTLDDEEYAVHRAVILDGAQGRSLPTDGVNAIINPDVEGGRPLAKLAEAMVSDMETSTVESFIARNRQGGRIEQRFGLAQPLFLVSPKDERNFVARCGCSNDCQGDEPTAYLWFSRVGLNHDRTQALVQSGAANRFGGGDHLIELHKIKGAWRVMQVFSGSTWSG